jgi:YbbR domain-containing protein
VARRDRSTRWYLFVAVVIAVLLWAVAHGSSSVERGFDLPVAFRNVPEDLVLTDQSTDVVNVRVLGSRAALRNLDAARAEYAVDASGAKSGSADFEVDVSRVDLPRGARIVSRSPSRLEVKFERRGTKVMQVRADLAGEPAEGFAVAGVEIEPPRVKVTGARAQVLRLEEAVTEAIDITGLTTTAEREARLNLGGENVWVEEPTTVRVRVRIEAAPPPGKG